MLVIRASATRRPGRTRNRAACAYAALAGPCGWPFGIAPFCQDVSIFIMITMKVSRSAPRPVVLNIVFLDLLDVVVGLRAVHAFRTDKISGVSTGLG